MTITENMKDPYGHGSVLYLDDTTRILTLIYCIIVFQDVTTWGNGVKCTQTLIFLTIA